MAISRALPPTRHLRALIPRPLQPAVRGLYLRAGPATSRFRMTPSFMVIGGQRCGTTTIFKSLAEHPQVMRPPVEKGTDYYTLNYSRGFSWYRGHFPLAGPAAVIAHGAGAPMAFEACTYYLFHPLAVERIARDFPDMLYVVMVRDPVARAWSAYKHELARGFETEPDFEHALDLEVGRLTGEEGRIRANPDYASFSHRHHAYVQRGQYADQLDRLFAHVPRSQVHVMESEAFFARPEREFTALLDFLGLSRWMPGQFDQHNARPSAAMPEGARARLDQHYESYDERLATLLGRTPTWRRGRG